ncbi:protein of unknown function [Burkholderia multivorans]
MPAGRVALLRRRRAEAWLPVSSRRAFNVQTIKGKPARPARRSGGQRKYLARPTTPHRHRLRGSSIAVLCFQ